jgi:hypothetical protein
MLKEMRILIQHRKTLRALFKVSFGQKDASLYLFPYGPTGKYFYGFQSIKEYEIERTFSYTEQFNAEKIPKLSIHQSGQIHIYSDQRQIAGPVYTIPLQKWRGEHIATVVADSFESLCIYKKKIKVAGSEVDHIIPCDDVVQNGRIAIYCNAQSPDFIYKCRMKVTMQRPQLSSPIHIGFAPIAQKSVEEKVKCGVTVIAGWNPRKQVNDNQDLLYIRAQ